MRCLRGRELAELSLRDSTFDVLQHHVDVRFEWGALDAALGQ
jgi:hypothetical protein